MNEFSSSALLDIQLTLLCVCGVDSFNHRIRTFVEKNFTVSFPKRRLWNLESSLVGDSFLKWRWCQLQLLRRAKLSRWDCLDYLENEAKCGNMAVLEIRCQILPLEKRSNIGSATGIICVVCHICRWWKIDHIHDDLALLVWGPALLTCSPFFPPFLFLLLPPPYPVLSFCSLSVFVLFCFCVCIFGMYVCAHLATLSSYGNNNQMIAVLLPVSGNRTHVLNRTQRTLLRRSPNIARLPNYLSNSIAEWY